MQIDPADIRLRPTGRAGALDVCRVIWCGADVGEIEVDYALHLAYPDLGMPGAIEIVEAMSAHERLQLLAKVRDDV